MKKIALALFVILPGSAVAGQTDPVLDAPCLLVNTSTGECMHYGKLSHRGWQREINNLRIG